jgi:hypothetical protein
MLAVEVSITPSPSLVREMVSVNPASSRPSESVKIIEENEDVGLKLGEFTAFSNIKLNSTPE